MNTRSFFAFSALLATATSAGVPVDQNANDKKADASSRAAFNPALDDGSGLHAHVPRRAQIPVEEDFAEAARGRMVVITFANCTLDRRGRAKIEAVLNERLGVELDRALRSLADSECLANGSFSIEPVLMRGALFIALWQRRVTMERHGGSWKSAILPFDSAFAAWNWDQAKQPILALLSFADCVVKRDRVDASSVVVLPTASNEQNESYSKLNSHLEPCLKMNGTMHLSKAIFEGALAEALYRSPAAATQDASAR